MKIKNILIGASLVLPFLVAVPVLAHEAASPDMPTSNQPSDPGNQKTREQRIAERKDKLERRLTQAEQTVVRTRCAAAKGLVQASQARLNSFAAKRGQVYSGLVERLQGLSPKLQAAGADTTKYDEQVGQLKAKADAYAAAMDSLKAAVDDLVAMDCTADPEGFVATLKEAIMYRQDVVNKGQDFRTYLKNVFKPTFAEVRAQVQAKRTESGA